MGCEVEGLPVVKSSDYSLDHLEKPLKPIPPTPVQSPFPRAGRNSRGKA